MASVTKRPGYGWQVRWKVEGKYHSKAFEKKKDADEYRRKVEHNISNGVAAGDGAMTVRKLCDQYLKAQEIRVADKRIGATTLKNARIAVDKDIIPLLGARPVATLKASDSVDLYTSMIRRGLAVVTAKGRMVVWGLVLKHARRSGVLTRDFQEEVRDELRGAEDERAPTFLVDEVEKLLRVLPVRRPWHHPRSHLYLQCAVYLAAFCGLRMGEVRGLRVEDIDFAGRLIKIRRTVTELNEVKGPKTKAGFRDVPAPAIVIDTLRAWLASYYVESPQQFVFLSKTGLLLGRHNFHEAFWWPLLRAADLLNEADRFHFHSLRHFYGSWLIDQGVPLPQVASLMGHSSINTTLRTYAHQLTGGRREHSVVDAFATRLLPTAPAEITIPVLRATPVARELREPV